MSALIVVKGLQFLVAWCVPSDSKHTSAIDLWNVNDTAKYESLRPDFAQIYCACHAVGLSVFLTAQI